MAQEGESAFDRLCQLAAELLDTPVSDFSGEGTKDSIHIDWQLALLTEYSSVFQEMIDQQTLQDLEPEALQRLNGLHSRVLSFAERLEPQLEGSMRDLRRRSQALKGYLGALPKGSTRTSKRKM